ncbi:MAG TPA: histidine ammonia-lyase [Acidobacteriota bacterium]|nr:histidine ammonia-lyase [Acidobacteriota bacterium]
MTLTLGDKPIDLQEIIKVAIDREPVALSDSARERVAAARACVEEHIASGEPVYGVTTGFGVLAAVAIRPEEIDDLQRNLIISHAAGMGPLLTDEVIRAAMLLRAVSLVAGHSGIRQETLDLLIAMLNRNVIPLVPSQGSVGSSGDLAPLSHIVLGMIGMGECRFDGREMDAAEALAAAGLKPVRLTAKEGLALVNGTQIMTAIAALAAVRARRLADLADIAGAATLEAVRGRSDAFDERLHINRPHQGQIISASNIRKLISDSKLVDSIPERMQDAYSLRTMPQVHGASRDAIDYVIRTLEIEANSVTDNPLIFPDSNDVISGGNFHGQPVALASDFLGIAVAELGSISERRINRMVDGSYPHLPMFVTPSPGLNSGLMVPHYLAAALVSENKGLAHPNSVDSIPTSANQEDHNSMGTIAARNAEQIVTNVELVVAVEIMVAAQALEFSDGKRLGKGTAEAYRLVRRAVTALEGDRYLRPDLEALRSAVVSDAFVAGVSEAVGELL